jgi:uracil-DNA glycosylase family 4
MVTNNLMLEIEQCNYCKNLQPYLKFPKLSHGKLDSSFMLLSEAPGKESIDKKKYWTGIGGSLFRGCAVKVGIQLEEMFYLTDIVKCWPKGKNGKSNRSPNLLEVTNCFEKFLKREILQLNPKLILSFGRTCTNILLNESEEKIIDLHGKCRLLWNTDILILPLLHPTNINWTAKKKAGNYTQDIYKKEITQLFNYIKNVNKGDVDFSKESIEEIFSYN